MALRSLFKCPFYLALAVFLLFSFQPCSGQLKCEYTHFRSLTADLAGKDPQRFEQARIQLGDCGKDGILALIEGLRMAATNPDRSDATSKSLSLQGKDAVPLLIQALAAEKASNCNLEC